MNVKKKQFYLACQYERVYASTDAQSINACPQMRFFLFLAVFFEIYGEELSKWVRLKVKLEQVSLNSN